MRDEDKPSPQVTASTQAEAARETEKAKDA
jgi:hypothetical protein